MAQPPVRQDPAPPVAEDPVTLYLAALTSELSRTTMRSKLDQVARLMTGRDDLTAVDIPWERLRPHHLDALRAVLAETYAPSTANCHLAAVRGVLRACWRSGRIAAEEYHRLIDLEPVRGDRLPPGRHLEGGELLSLMMHCRQDEKPNRGARDACLLAVLYAGLRRGECAALMVEDVDLERESVKVLHAKGGKQRLVPLVLGAAGAIEGWLERRGRQPGPLLLAVNKADAIQPAGLSGSALGKILQRLARETGLKSFTPHDFRRTWIGDLLDAGADVVTAQQLAGHASPTTTGKYDRRPAEARRKAARLLRLP